MALFFWIDGRVVPKARPRLGGRKVFLPEHYRKWKRGAIAAIKSQLEDGFLPLKSAAVGIEFIGAHKGDLDNLAGAILDALVQSGAIADDRLSCLPSLFACHIPSKNKAQIGARVKIYDCSDLFYGVKSALWEPER